MVWFHRKKKKKKTEMEYKTWECLKKKDRAKGMGAYTIQINQVPFSPMNVFSIFTSIYSVN